MDWIKPLNPRGEASAGDNNDTQVAWLRVAVGQAAPGQIAVARKVFATHLADISLSLAGYHAVTYNLPDGSRLRIVSNSGIHHATLWPTSVVPVPKLPHGFAVVTNWADPKIFKRRTTPTVAWSTDPIQVPQCNTDLEGDNQVFRATSATAYFNHPMVLTDGDARSLWDYLKHRAPPLASASPVVPLCTQAGADYSTQVMHYGVDNVIYNNAGASIYTMTLSPEILLVDPETPVHAPAATTAAGTEVVLQHLRLALISPSFGIYTARFANERLARLDEANYSLTERNVVSFTGPIGDSAPAGGAVTSTLGEIITTEQFLRYGAIGPGGVGGSTGFATYVSVFSYTNEHDLTPHTTETEVATKEVGTFTSDPEPIYDALALPESNSVLYPQIVASAGVSGTVNWRAGYIRKGTNWPGSIADYSLSAWYGAWTYRKDRIDAQYQRDTSPSIYVDLGWAHLQLLHGASAGLCDGKTYSDTKTHGRDGANWDGNYLLRTYIVSGVAPLYFGAPGERPIWEAAMSAMDIKSEIIAYLEPAYPATLGGPGTITTTVLVNERPINTGEYALTSRYVIDFDHKGQFYAAIKVTVECSGAEWRESGYEGNMVEYAQPDYIVSVYLETNWKGTVNQTLLTTATATRSAFEFQEIVKQNPYYFLFPLETGKQDMIVRLPPSFGLPMEAMTQIPTICTHQGASTHLACADVRSDITGPAATKVQSTAGIEFSSIEGGAIKPHMKYVTGQLYARTFKLADFPDALWLLHSTKCDATEDDLGAGPSYFYMPALKTTIDTVDFHVEVRDGVHETWSDEIAPGPGQPAAAARDIKLYRV